MIRDVPHLSRKKVNKKISEEINKQLISLLQNSSPSARVRILEELLTDTERVMITKRVGIILFLTQGMSSYKISEILGVSSSTVDRFSVSSSRFHYTSEWLKKNTVKGKVEALLTFLGSFIFPGKRRSFKKFVEEY